MANTTPVQKKKRFWTMERKQSAAGWMFLAPAAIMIFVFSFWPMFQAFLISLKKGLPTALQYSDPLWRNYQFMLKDKVFIQSVTNTFTYLIYILDLRMNHAQKLLRTSNLSISEISTQCGFDDVFYFSRLYKSKIGISPSAERKTRIE